MKKLILSALALILLSSFSTALHAQEAKRFEIKMNIQYNGKAIVVDGVASLNYSIQRPPIETNSTTKGNDAASANASFNKTPLSYISIALDHLSKGVLELMANKDITFDGDITMKDTYGKIQPREMKFKKARFNAASESLSAYSYENNGGAATLGLESDEITIDGVEIKP